MKEAIIAALRDFFELSENDSLTAINRLSAAATVQYLPELITVLTSDRCLPPKMTAQAVENIIVSIRLKSEPTELETQLLAALKEVREGQAVKANDMRRP